MSPRLSAVVVVVAALSSLPSRTRCGACKGFQSALAIGVYYKLAKKIKTAEGGKSLCRVASQWPRSCLATRAKWNWGVGWQRTEHEANKLEIKGGDYHAVITCKCIWLYLSFQAGLLSISSTPEEGRQAGTNARTRCGGKCVKQTTVPCN